MPYRAIHLATPRFARLLGTLRSGGFELSVGDFVEFLNEQDLDRQQWIESASEADVLDWIAEVFREQN